MPIDFATLADDLLVRAETLLPQWLPGGKFVGSEFVVGNLAGEPGRSLSINWHTGQWGDFATGEKGGDLISLYAAMHGMKNADAARKLGATVTDTPQPRRKKKADAHPAGIPPEDAPEPTMRHGRFGNPVRTWEYRGASGELLGYVARYEPPRMRKQIVPWSWIPSQKRWAAKSLPKPRPLYGLDLLADQPDKPVMVVEGEKAADAAREMCGHVYVVVTWPGGGKTTQYVDWSPIHGRKTLLWPDADKEGVKTMQNVGALLKGKCPEVKAIEPSGKPDGWDAADAEAAGWDWAQFKEWAQPRTSAASGEPVVKPSTSRIDMHMSFGLDLTSSGAPVNNLNNAVIILEQHEELKDLLWFDEFHGKIFTQWRCDEPREWSDGDDVELALFLQRECGITRMSVSTAHDAAMNVARRRRRNEVREWLESMEWDRRDRLSRLMITGFGTEDGPYTRRVGEAWMVSMIARVFEPGCKVDTMPVFEGDQGAGKSSALGVIGGKWFTECHESVLSKDFYGVLQGNLLVEISEMHSFGRAEIDRVKGVISCATDRYRPPYGRNTLDYPRQSVFAGSTNKRDWNRDETGARRFWPIRCGKRVNLEWLRENRAQLFAEALVRYREGDAWWEIPEAEAKAEQEARRQHDVWEEVIGDWLATTFFTQVTISQVLNEALNIEPGRQGRIEQLRAGSALTLLGWERKNARIDGRVRKVWVKGDAPG